MSYQIVMPAGGGDYEWSQDHILVKTPAVFTGGQLTVVVDTLKPGFHLPRHHHKKMTEVFYVLDGVVVFAFDAETVTAAPGTTINIAPQTWHAVSSAPGAKLMTIFSPGGFDEYLQALAAMTPAQLADPALMQTLSEEYDTWTT